MNWIGIRRWLRYRPLLKCPVCCGEGGWMMGWEEPEFCECPRCFPAWYETQDAFLEWTAGRLPLTWWPHAKLYRTTGHDTVRGWLACKAGWHKWIDESDLEPGLKICCRCYEDNKGYVKAAEREI